MVGACSLRPCFSYFSWFPARMNVPSIDYAHKQRELLAFEEDLANAPHVSLVPRTWLRELTDWVAGRSGLDSNVRAQVAGPV